MNLRSESSGALVTLPLTALVWFCRKHDAPVKTIHWIKAPNYSCVMTGSWDKTLKVCSPGGGAHGGPPPARTPASRCLRSSVPQFWDTRSSNPMMVLQLPERCYCADMVSGLPLRVVPPPPPRPRCRRVPVAVHCGRPRPGHRCLPVFPSCSALGVGCRAPRWSAPPQHTTLTVQLQEYRRWLRARSLGVARWERKGGLSPSVQSSIQKGGPCRPRHCTPEVCLKSGKGLMVSIVGDIVKRRRWSIGLRGGHGSVSPGAGAPWGVPDSRWCPRRARFEVTIQVETCMCVCTRVTSRGEAGVEHAVRSLEGRSV